MMEDSKKTTATTWIKYGLAGFLLGLCIVSISAVGLFAVQIANPPPTPTLVPTPTIAAQALLEQAEQALYTDRGPQFILDTLGPHLAEFSDPDDQAKALEYMALAEMNLGHYQMSAAYLERLCQLSPTPEHYGLLARVYDSGGDLEHALANYMIYLKSDDPALTPDVRQLIQDRVGQIQSILTSFTPTPAP
jgi:hypothetical protein